MEFGVGEPPGRYLICTQKSVFMSQAVFYDHAYHASLNNGFLIDKTIDFSSTTILWNLLWNHHLMCAKKCVPICPMVYHVQKSYSLFTDHCKKIQKEAAAFPQLALTTPTGLVGGIVSYTATVPARSPPGRYLLLYLLLQRTDWIYLEITAFSTKVQFRRNGFFNRSLENWCFHIHRIFHLN